MRARSRVYRASLIVATMAAVGMAAGTARPAYATSVTMQAQASQWLVIVTGLGGEDRFRTRFHTQATQLIDAAVDRWGVPEDQVIYLAEDPSLDASLIQAKSTREEIEAAVSDIAARAAGSDAIVIVLIGHGSGGDGDPKMNLPGRDLTAAEWAGLLDEFGARPVAFINTASSSGGFVEAVSAPNRVTITATRSGRERSETRFARFFIEAFAEEGADTDKDSRISMLEAFEYARSEVARSYEEEGILLTEHALLDDDGDGEGSQTPDASAGDGDAADRFYLGGAAGARAAAASSTAGQAGNPELTALYAEKARLEAAIDDLREIRDSMSPDDYENSLEDLLVDLTLTTREIDRLEGETR